MGGPIGNRVLPSDVEKRKLRWKRVLHSAGTKYTGLQGDIISIDRFGESAPAGLLFKNMVFTVEECYGKGTETAG